MTLTLREQVPLAPLTTLGIGGPARHYLLAESAQDVVDGVRWASARGLPLLILGGGSNLVVADEGFPGLVLHLATGGIETQGDGDWVELTAAAGEGWDDVVALAVARGWAGLECLSGIPGRVGATPIQNVGAYGQEIAETLVRLEALDRVTLRRLVLSHGECGFAYRDSRFKRADRNRHVLLSVTFRLRVQGPPSVRYPELAAYLSDQGLERPTLHDLRQAVLALRRRKSMVFDPDDPESHSVGSFFTNPVVDTALATGLEAQLRQSGLLGEGERVPSFPAAGGRCKLSAAWLIESAGFPKGYAHGGVGISNRHALALVNRGGGTAREIVELARQIRNEVHERFGISLEPEPVLVGLEL